LPSTCSSTRAPSNCCCRRGDMIPAGATGSDLSVGVHHNLGMLYLRQERWEEARDVFLRAASLCGPDANEVRAEELFQVAQIAIHLNHPIPRSGPGASHRGTSNTQCAALEPPRPAARAPEATGAGGQYVTPVLSFVRPHPGEPADAASVFFRRKYLSDAILLGKTAAEAADTMITAHVIVQNRCGAPGRAQEGLEYIEDRSRGIQGRIPVDGACEPSRRRRSRRRGDPERRSRHRAGAERLRRPPACA